MQRIFFGGLSILALLIAAPLSVANAADMPVNAPLPPPPESIYNWTGFYVGAQVGGATGTANFADPFGPSIFGDNVTTPGFFVGGQVGYNWQAPNSGWVLGVQADANWLTADGTNTCFAFKGFFISATCQADPDAFGTLTARGGYAFGPTGSTLLYAKGGAAWIHENVKAVTNGAITFGGLPVPNLITDASSTLWGWTAGAGVEHALAPGWTLFVEYDYLNFRSLGIGTPESVIQSPPGGLYIIFPPSTTSVRQDIHEVKLGVNYKFGADPWTSWDGVASAL